MGEFISLVLALVIVFIYASFVVKKQDGHFKIEYMSLMRLGIASIILGILVWDFVLFAMGVVLTIFGNINWKEEVKKKKAEMREKKVKKISKKKK